MTDGTGSGAAPDARALLAMVQEWAQRTMPEPPSGHGGPECQWCPLCQFASILRGEHPEVADRLAEAGAALAGALRTFVEAAANRTTARPAAPRPRPRPSPTSPRVQHIRLDDAPESGG